jgi:hypothetical protein
MTFRSSGILAGAAMACTLVGLWPAPTCAEEVPDSERAGEWTEDGLMKFGEIVIQGELVADAKVPGGWVLVRTIANPTDEPQTTTVEERVMRQLSQVGARVDGTPLVASATMRTFKLGPHETRKLGVALPASIGQAIAAGQRTRRIAESAGTREAAYDRTYPVFTVQYLKPLPPGGTAEVVREIMGPARMPSVMPPRQGLAANGWE